jgi:hypothetical protein
MSSGGSFFSLLLDMSRHLAKVSMNMSSIAEHPQSLMERTSNGTDRASCIVGPG